MLPTLAFRAEVTVFNAVRAAQGSALVTIGVVMATVSRDQVGSVFPMAPTDHKINQRRTSKKREEAL